jgi:hypothetical protein
VSDEVWRVALQLRADSPEDLERFGIDLQRDLQELPSMVALAEFAAPAGTKSGAGIDWSQMLLTLLASGGALSGLIGLIQARLGRERKVKLVIDGDELEVGGLDQAQQRRLIDAWLSRRKPRRGKRG